MTAGCHQLFVTQLLIALWKHVLELVVNDEQEANVA
jgi:hypothetical protein